MPCPPAKGTKAFVDDDLAATGGPSLPQPYLLGQDADGVRRLVLDASAAGDALAERLAGAGLQVLPRRLGRCSIASLQLHV